MHAVQKADKGRFLSCGLLSVVGATGATHVPAMPLQPVKATCEHSKTYMFVVTVVMKQRTMECVVLKTGLQETPSCDKAAALGLNMLLYYFLNLICI